MVQAREGLHLMEWKHQEAGPSVPTPLILDTRDDDAPFEAHDTHCAQKDDIK